MSPGVRYPTNAELERFMALQKELNLFVEMLEPTPWISSTELIENARGLEKDTQRMMGSFGIWMMKGEIQ